MSAPLQEYSVLVRCFTYNHSKYIEDTLNGFVMQQTSFPFVCLIVDDASTDKEPEVIKSFLQRECDMENVEFKEIEEAHIISVHHKKNSNCLMVVYLLKNNLYTQKEKKMALVKPWRDACKYEAMCEGDDYWTDPLKLQKQVDFLENHIEYGMCYSNFSKYNQKNGILTKNCLKKEQILRFNNLSNWIKLASYTGPMTWVYKKELILSTPNFNTVDGTFVSFAHFLANSKVHCLIEDNTAVYRELEKSASHFMSISKYYKYKKGLHDTQIEMINYYRNIIEDSEQLKVEVSKGYYRHYLYYVILEGGEKEIKRTLTFVDDSWPWFRKFIIQASQYPLFRKFVSWGYRTYLTKHYKMTE